MAPRKLLHFGLGLLLVLVAVLIVKESIGSFRKKNNVAGDEALQEAPHETIERLRQQALGREAIRGSIQEVQNEILKLNQDINGLSFDNIEEDSGDASTGACQHELTECMAELTDPKSRTPGIGPDGKQYPPTTKVLGLLAQMAKLRAEYEAVMKDKRNLTQVLAQVSVGSKCGPEISFNDVMTSGERLVVECSDLATQEATRTVNLHEQLSWEKGRSAKGDTPVARKLQPCTADDPELLQYLNYTPGARCPDDWLGTQSLIFDKGCYCLPTRRCFAPTAPNPKEPEMGLPKSLFDQRALMDENVRWDQHGCKSYECLNAREEGDCRNCFNMSLENHRWRKPFNGVLPISSVLQLKPKGSLRIGLDAGGGTGTFAAHMARFGVTIVTTAWNVETLGKMEGLPYMETIAQRGLVPVHVPHKARLPFFDNTLDVIHSSNSIKYFTLPEFETLLFEWDRVLRPGGLLWFDMFYTEEEEMQKYIKLLDSFGFLRLYWNVTPKEDVAEKEGKHVYLNCVLEKPRR